jgi:D-lactate dehydrogenase
MAVDTTALVNALQTKIDRSRILTDAADCLPYSYDYSRNSHPPDAVVFATSHQEVVHCLSTCYQLNIPVVPRGEGTGIVGGSVPIHGGVVLSLERMQQILAVDVANRCMRVQPGVLNQSVQDKAAEHGFFWPPDPSSRQVCSVGGNLAHNSAGPRAVKYGTPRENTLGLQAVTADGKTLRTGVYTTKGVVGYDLTRLLIGSEGTLAVITEATLKLTPLPEAIGCLRVLYKDIHSAASAVSHIMAQPVIPYTLEFLDSACLNLIREHSSLDLPAQAQAMLLIEVDGPRVALPSAIQAIQQAASNAGLIGIDHAQTAAEKAQLWQARKTLSPTLRKIAAKKINEDVVVPVAQMAPFIQQLAEFAQTYQITIVNFGHAGNGNIHVNLLVDPNDAEQMQRSQQCLHKIFTLVIQLGGSLSGEHGVGLAKQNYIGYEIDPVTLELMQKIKQQFDPKHLLNPGKIFPKK